MRHRPTGKLDWPLSKRSDGADDYYTFHGKPVGSHRTMKRVPVPWRRLMVQLAMHYDWDKKTIGRLTLYEAYMYTAKTEELGGVSKMDDKEARNFLRSRGR